MRAASLRTVTHYEVLGVRPTASDAEIRRAYLRLARRHHPDLQVGGTGDGSEDAMRRINEAWAVLGSADRRRRYDEDLRAAERALRTPGAADPAFVPYDAGEDVDYASLLDDTPVEGTRLPRWLQTLPAWLLAVAVLAGSAGLAASFRPLLALAVVALVGSALTFLAAPATAVLRSYQAERD